MNADNVVHIGHHASASRLSMAVGHVSVVEELEHLKAAEMAHEQGAVFFYRNRGCLYRMHRFGDQFIIIDHATGGYWVTPLLKEGMIALQSWKSFECLSILIKHKLPMRGWLEYCVLTARNKSHIKDDGTPSLMTTSMKSLYEELIKFF